MTSFKTFRDGQEKEVRDVEVQKRKGVVDQVKYRVAKLSNLFSRLIVTVTYLQDLLICRSCASIFLSKK